MDLKDFIRETIVQIARGIEEANGDLDNSDAMVNPIYMDLDSASVDSSGRTKIRTNAYPNPDSRVVHNVEFDVAVVAERVKEGSGGAKLSIASVGIGGEGRMASNDKSESRIRFSIPIVFPGYTNEK